MLVVTRPLTILFVCFCHCVEEIAVARRLTGWGEGITRGATSESLRLRGLNSTFLLIFQSQFSHVI